MPTLSERIRACLVLDPTTEAVLHVQTDRGADVSLVTLSPEDLCGIAEAEDAVALLAREQRMREETRLDLVEKTSALFLAQTNLAAEREKSAKGLACIQDAIQKTEALTKERDEARARVKALEGSAEPFTWACIGTNGMMHSTHASEADAAKYRHGTDVVEALYRRPPKPAGEPVAYGVEDERWAVFMSSNGWFVTFDDGRQVSTREGAHNKTTGNRELVRIIRADAPVVDVAAIRKAIEHLVDIHAYGAVGTLRAAIGEKGGV